MSRTVIVTTGSRLHFGLFAFGRARGRQYGGIGAMIAEPAVRVRITEGVVLTVTGPLAERAAEYAERVCARMELRNDLPVKIEVISAPPDHVGLGVGTQLGLAIAAGLQAFYGRSALGATALSALVGRGKRSAIGTYGFLQGGLLWEDGKTEDEELSPLVGRAELPTAWRFVLVRPMTSRGLSGESERQAFAELPPVPETVEAELRMLATERLAPAAAAGDFEQFTETLTQYSRLAGNCYAARQGGPFANGVVARLAEQMESLGGRGVGQSSWGPTLFAVAPDATAAEQLAQRISVAADCPVEVTIAEPLNRGAAVDVVDEPA